MKGLPLVLVPDNWPCCWALASQRRNVSHRLSEEERQRILLTCSEPEFAALPPEQIAQILAGRGLYNSSGEDCVYGSERSFYRALRAPTARPTSWSRPDTNRAQTGSPAAGRRAECRCGAGTSSTCPPRSRRVAESLPSDRCLEKQRGGLGCHSTGCPSIRSGSGKQGLPERANQQGSEAAFGAACR